MNEIFQNYVLEKSNVDNNKYYFMSPEICVFVNTYEQLKEFVRRGCEMEINKNENKRVNWLVFRDGVEKDFSVGNREELREIIDNRNNRL
jgi:hypothetical protein